MRLRNVAVESAILGDRPGRRRYGFYWFPLSGPYHLGGISPTGTPVAATFARSTTATYVHPQTGLLATAAIDAPRFTMDPTGTLSLYVEPRRTNVLRQSRTLSTSPWTTSGIGAMAQDQVGVDGAANTAWALTDNSSGASQSIYQTGTLTSSTNYICASVLIKKDNDETRFPALQLNLSGGTAKVGLVRLNTKTGAVGIGASYVPTYYGAFSFNSGWWCLWLSLQQASNTGFTLYIKPACSNVLSGGSDVNAATGSIVADCPQVELYAGIDCTGPTTPIVTTSSNVTRSYDSLTYPVIVTPSNHAVAATLIPMPGSLYDGLARAVTFNGTAGANATGRIYMSTSWALSPLASGGYNYNANRANFTELSLNRLVYHVKQVSSNIVGNAWLNGTQQSTNSTAAGTLGGMDSNTQIGGYGATAVNTGWIRDVIVINSPSTSDTTALINL